MKIPKNIDIHGLDNFIMKEILHDVVSGTLLTQADDKTLNIMLIHIWEMKQQFEQMGVVIGES
jgi:hypothetical protein|tara:strand:- start:195 stop:383 length:189 start_codon:yes stop_codon:yes gene_type:complete